MRISDWSSDVCSSDLGLGARFELEVTGQDLRYVFTYQQLVQILQIGQAVEHEYAFDQTIGMFHFTYGLVVFVFAQLVQAPVIKHAGVQKVLVDGGERSEEHTSELQSLMRISYAVFCLKKKKNTTKKL